MFEVSDWMMTVHWLISFSYLLFYNDKESNKTSTIILSIYLFLMMIERVINENFSMALNFSYLCLFYMRLFD
jgi:hypothetical protein